MCCRVRSFDLLPLIEEMVHLTQYTFSERPVHVSSIDVPFFKYLFNTSYRNVVSLHLRFVLYNLKVGHHDMLVIFYLLTEFHT